MIELLDRGFVVRPEETVRRPTRVVPFMFFMPKMSASHRWPFVAAHVTTHGTAPRGSMPKREATRAHARPVLRGLRLGASLGRAVRVA
jgi:hypothetical protein